MKFDVLEETGAEHGGPVLVVNEWLLGYGGFGVSWGFFGRIRRDCNGGIAVPNPVNKISRYKYFTCILGADQIRANGGYCIVFGFCSHLSVLYCTRVVAGKKRTTLWVLWGNLDGTDGGA